MSTEQQPATSLTLHGPRQSASRARMAIRFGSPSALKSLGVMISAIFARLRFLAGPRRAPARNDLLVCAIVQV